MTGNPDIRARRATFHSGLDRFTFTYDGLNRLLSVTGTLSSGSTANESFAYDGATSLTSRTGPSATYTIDGANRITSDGTRSFVWDAADRLVTRGADTFAYDPLSRLLSSTVSGVTRTYAYDGDGLLRSRTEGALSTSFLYDPSVAPAPLLQAGAERLVYGLGPLYRAHADGSFEAYARDALGSVRAEVSGAGKLTNAFDYAAYGALRASLAGPPLLGFAGELTDPSGLIYLRSRWYEPSVGRFLARDPFAGGLHQPSSLNGFAYVGGRPTMLVDPLGLDPAAARSNWAYTVAQIFADLDSPDPFQRTTAQIIIVAGGLAVSGFLVAGVATLVPSGVAAAKATTAAGIAVGANVYVIGENALQRVVPFATAIGISPSWRRNSVTSVATPSRTMRASPSRIRAPKCE